MRLTLALCLLASPALADAGAVIDRQIAPGTAAFTAAAQEAGESRLYGGIHFYEGNVVGLDLGRRCGDAAYARAQDLWSGA